MHGFLFCPEKRNSCKASNALPSTYADALADVIYSSLRVITKEKIA